MADQAQPLSPRIKVVDADGYLTRQGFDLLQSLRTSIVGGDGAAGVVGLEQLIYALSGRPSQPLSMLLLGLAGMDEAAGLVTQTGPETFAKRSLQAPAAGISITNPAGTAGDPTLALANDLAALEALASTGLAARTAADTWAQRTITGTANQISVTNGSGAAGNPTLSLAVGDVLIGAYTPTISATTNIDATASPTAFYLRVGSLVLVWGSVQIDPTTAGTTCLFDMTIPIASNFAGSELHGVINSLRDSGVLAADTTDDGVIAAFSAGANTNATYQFVFAYQIV